MPDNKESSKRAFQKANENDVLFRRAEIIHQLLMEDFRFMEAARIYSGEYEAATLNTKDLFPQDKFKKLIITNPYGLVNFGNYSLPIETDDDQSGAYKPDVRSLHFQTKMAKYPPLEIWAHWLLNTSIFQAMMVLVIIINSILIAWDQELGASDDTSSQRRVLENVDFFFLMLFIAEILLKLLDDFRGFWFEGWDIFDFTCTVSSLIPPILDVLFPGTGDDSDGKAVLDIVKYLRILRVFRSLNVVTRIHNIQIIWESVLKTFNELFSITILMAIFFYIFAIIGIHLFERFSQSHVSKLEYRTAFVNIPQACVHLFLVFTVDQYELLLNSLAQVMGYALPVFFILIWILLAGFIFQNIFTGVMVNNFQNIRETLVDESSEIESHRKLAMQLAMDENMDEEEKAEGHLAWEKDTFQNLQILSALAENLSPSVWPRDTLFQYYVLLEAVATNVDERGFLLRQLDQALIHQMDP